MTRLRALAVVLIVLGGLGYADWVIQLALPVQADLTSSFISELSAVNQPYHHVFRTADVVAGLLLGAGAGLAWLLTRRHAAVWAPLVLLGACTVFEAISPLPDSYTFGTSMPEPGTGAWWAKVSEPHGVSSLLETVAFLLVLVTCTAALRRSGAGPRSRHWLRWPGWLAVVGILAALCGVVDAVLTATLLLNGDAIGLGLVQRLGVTATAVWLALAPAALLLRTPPRPGGGSARSAGRDQGSRSSSCESSTRRPV